MQQRETVIALIVGLVLTSEYPTLHFYEDLLQVD